MAVAAWSGRPQGGVADGLLPWLPARRHLPGRALYGTNKATARKNSTPPRTDQIREAAGQCVGNGASGGTRSPLQSRCKIVR